MACNLFMYILHNVFVSFKEYVNALGVENVFIWEFSLDRSKIGTLATKQIGLLLLFVVLWLVEPNVG